MGCKYMSDNIIKVIITAYKICVVSCMTCKKITLRHLTILYILNHAVLMLGTVSCLNIINLMLLNILQHSKYSAAHHGWGFTGTVILTVHSFS